jgi:hypothetical protein
VIFYLLLVNRLKKEVKPMKKILLVATIALSAICFSALPVFAYTTIPGADTVITITAQGTLSGNTVSFTATVVDQADETDREKTLQFPDASTGKVNSGKCIKMTGGTNVVGARIIIATDNAALFTDPSQDPRWKDSDNDGILEPTGSDGSGMIGVSNKGYVAPLIWGVTDTPNVRPTTYTFGDYNWSYVVDTWHERSYVPTLADGVTVDPDYAALDTAQMYRVESNVPETNPANEGGGRYKKLYPQYFGKSGENMDLYDKPSTDPTRKVYTINKTPVGQALYQNIATVAYSIQIGDEDIMTGSSGYFICQLPKLSTPASDDFVFAKLKKTDGTIEADSYIYIPVGAVYTGLPAQDYRTSKLFAQMVQD